MTLPKYDPAEECTKCGCDEWDVEFRVDFSGTPRVKSECLWLSCKRCGNKFARACLDAKEEV